MSLSLDSLEEFMLADCMVMGTMQGSQAVGEGTELNVNAGVTNPLLAVEDLSTY